MSGFPEKNQVDKRKAERKQAEKKAGHRDWQNTDGPSRCTQHRRMQNGGL